MKAAALLITLAVTAPAARAQSLADAAARAEEQRHRAGTPSPTLTNNSLPGEWTITTAGLEQYANARTDIASIRRHHADVHQRLWNASINAGALADLEPALAGEPLIAAALNAAGLTARDYLKREQALVNAERWARGPVPPGLDRRTTRWANSVYLHSARAMVDRLERRYRAIEGGDIWWASWRFVED